MSSGAEKLKNNKSIAILDAAERGSYGIVSVVCVRSFSFAFRKGAVCYSILLYEDLQVARVYVSN